MPSIRNGSLSRTRIVSTAWIALFLTAAALSTAGCAHVNNPWRDSSAVVDADMTTPSAEGFHGKSEFGKAFRRDYEESARVYPCGATTHWPLWFEDPFEVWGNEIRPMCAIDEPDAAFAWNGIDYLHILAGPARFVTNTVGWPISAIVTPPGLLMESDGQASRGLPWPHHDACRSNIEKRDPPDVVTAPSPS